MLGNIPDSDRKSAYNALAKIIDEMTYSNMHLAKTGRLFIVLGTVLNPFQLDGQPLYSVGFGSDPSVLSM